MVIHGCRHCANCKASSNKRYCTHPFKNLFVQRNLLTENE
uniref:Uncharacterized protein n=1 Tax=Arundo donax TaxID=35708 RepID=A0A0A9E0X6_ARUDO